MTSQSKTDPSSIGVDTVTDDQTSTSDRPNVGQRLGGNLPLLVTIIAGIVLVAGTIGPPLFGQGVFLASDSISRADPWRAVIDPSTENIGHHGPVGDTVDSVYPGRAALYDGLRNGDDLTWNPYVIGGYPRVAAYSPFGLFSYLLLPNWFAPAAIKLLTMGTAVGFTYLFCRRLGTERVPAVLAGLGFAGSSFMVMWTNWPQPEVAALIPALFWATERFLQEPRVRTSIPIALAVAFMLLGNFPAVVGYSLYALVVYVLVRIASLWKAWSIRHTLAQLFGVGAAVVSGVLLVAAMLLPFALRLGYIGTGTRGQSPKLRLGVESLITTIAPKALGLSTEGPEHGWFGSHNQVEVVSFIGITLVILALVGLALPSVSSTPRGARAALAVTTLVLGWATFVGGDVLGFLQRMPVFENNFIGRTRSVLGFTVAILAALGLQALLDARWPIRARQQLWAAFVVITSIATSLVVFKRTLDFARAAERSNVLREGLLLPAAIGTVAMVAIAALAVGTTRKRPGWLRPAALGLLPALFVVEALALALPLLPNEDRSTLYPTTPGIDFLVENSAGERVVPENLVLFGNAGQLFGIRTVTGHSFHAPTWKDGLKAVDPDAFKQSETFSFLSARPDVMSSPVLDRMGARWFAGSAATAPPGERDGTATDEATCEDTIQLEDSLTAEVDAGSGARGVIVHICEPAALPWEATLSVTMGGVTGRDHLAKEIPVGPRTIAIPAEDVSQSGSTMVEFSLSNPAGDPLTLASTPAGEPVLDVVRPANDGLRLVYADDLRIYERTRTLPRVRWSARAEVVESAEDRLSLMATGDLPADTVVLSDPGPSGSGGDARVDVTRDDPTSLAVTVEADGAGYLVISDAIQRDWAAKVDGRDVDLVEADHFGAALLVPEGKHEIEVRYNPRGRHLGIVISAIVAITLAGLWVWDRRRQRRH